MVSSNGIYGTDPKSPKTNDDLARTQIKVAEVNLFYVFV